MSSHVNRKLPMVPVTDLKSTKIESEKKIMAVRDEKACTEIELQSAKKDISKLKLKIAKLDNQLTQYKNGSKKAAAAEKKVLKLNRKEAQARDAQAIQQLTLQV